MPRQCAALFQTVLLHARLIQILFKLQNFVTSVYLESNLLN
jgi:hypothetical protein